MTLQATQIILRPVVTEKSMAQTSSSKYTFAVDSTANKMQIKSAVEELFSVTVLNVNVSTVKGKEKSRNRGRNRQTGYTTAWKKAVVTVKSGESIEFFEGV